MKLTIIRKITIETDAKTSAKQLIDDFDGYMAEAIGSPHGNVFSHETGEDLGEINLVNFDKLENLS